MELWVFVIHIISGLSTQLLHFIYTFFWYNISHSIPIQRKDLRLLTFKRNFPNIFTIFSTHTGTLFQCSVIFWHLISAFLLGMCQALDVGPFLKCASKLNIIASNMFPSQTTDLISTVVHLLWRPRLFLYFIFTTFLDMLVERSVPWSMQWRLFGWSGAFHIPQEFGACWIKLVVHRGYFDRTARMRGSDLFGTAFKVPLEQYKHGSVSWCDVFVCSMTAGTGSSLK